MCASEIPTDHPVCSPVSGYPPNGYVRLCEKRTTRQSNDGGDTCIRSSNECNFYTVLATQLGLLPIFIVGLLVVGFKCTSHIESKRAEATQDSSSSGSSLD